MNLFSKLALVGLGTLAISGAMATDNLFLAQIKVVNNSDEMRFIGGNLLDGIWKNPVPNYYPLPAHSTYTAIVLDTPADEGYGSDFQLAVTNTDHADPNAKVCLPELQTLSSEAPYGIVGQLPVPSRNQLPCSPADFVATPAEVHVTVNING